MSDQVVGGIYRDKDPRSDGRHLKVLSADSRFAQCVGCSPQGVEFGKRTRISLEGLRTRFVRVGGAPLKSDLERAVIESVLEWREATRILDGKDVALPAGISTEEAERVSEAIANLNASVDSLSRARE